MALRTLFLLVIFYPAHCFSQFVDDFSDGNLSANPTWRGDTSSFVISFEGELQSNAPSVSDTAHLFTPFNPDIDDTLRWLWSWRLEFSPSNNNCSRVFLMASDSNLLEGHGYFIHLGKNGSDDVLEFYHFENSAKELLLSGSTNLSDSPHRRIEVTRYPTGLWQVQSAEPDGQYTLEGSVADTQSTASSFFGVWCKYTSSNSTSFFFDNFEVDSTILDTIPPKITLAMATGAHRLKLDFDEQLDPSTALTVSNYQLVNGSSLPSAVALDTIDSSSVLLTFLDSFQVGKELLITAYNIADRSGNAHAEQSFEFVYFDWLVPRFHDVVINEVMADPTPSAGLPEVEFIELYNTSGRYIQLDSFAVGDATSTSVLPPGLFIGPKAYVILCDEVDTLAMHSFGKIVGISGFPSLNNSGDDVVLRRPGTLLDSIHYDQTWYGNELSEAGGYALERINPYRPCSEAQNWRASLSTSGGTPGAQNSLYTISPDTTAPVVQSAAALSFERLSLQLSEALDTGQSFESALILDGHSLTVTHLANTVIKADVYPPLTEGVAYNLELQNLYDCSGNKLSDTTIIIGVPVSAEPFDLIINEIHANPTELGPLPNAEFVELFNRTNRLISTDLLQLADQTSVAKLPAIALPPKSYAIVCASKDASLFDGLVLPVSSFPSLNNSGDHLRLLLLESVIDDVMYSSEWHRDELKKGGGWSLERVDPDALCKTDSNWYSSNSVTQGTPGKVNSVYKSLPDSPLTIEALYFSEAEKLSLLFDRRVDTSSIHGAYLNGRYVDIHFTANAQAAGITLDSVASKGQTYSLDIYEISTCAGIPFSPLSASTYLANGGDVLINEILFHARDGGTEFVELINTTAHNIPLQSWSFASDIQGSATSFPVTNRLLEVGPGEIIAFHENRESLELNYPLAESQQLFETQLPSLPNDAGRCYLLNPFGEVMDSLYYFTDMHFALITDPEGVSLERLSTNRASMDKGNWHSASSTDNYGTPGYVNSQFLDSETDRGSVWLSSTHVSPDNDGFQDVVNVEFSGLSPGYSATVRVFSQDGAPIRTVASNRLVGNRGTISWDGSTDLGKAAELGIHLILVELFDMKGQHKRYRLPVVVAGNL
ncbi:MAG: lamin tail domain-containing protein [Cryomorphaceae bacterium]